MADQFYPIQQDQDLSDEINVRGGTANPHSHSSRDTQNSYPSGAPALQPDESRPASVPMPDLSGSVPNPRQTSKPKGSQSEPKHLGYTPEKL